MNFLDALHTNASGLSAQRIRMNLISSNLANMHTTRTKQGGPYKRKDAIFVAQSIRNTLNFKNVWEAEMHSRVSKVKVAKIIDNTREPIMKYDPSHPDANPKGYVAMPNVNLVEEMANMISATRSYEANATAIGATKNMALKALEIGR